MMKPIYVIYLMKSGLRNEVVKAEYVGFYHEIETCREVLHNNVMDIQNGEYTNAFIFITYPGLFAANVPELREFYKWDAARQGFF